MTILASVNNKSVMPGVTAIPDVPDRPTIGTVTRTNNTTVSVPFTAATTGGSPTSYTVSATPSVGDISTNAGTTSPRTVTGTFVSNTGYTFTIRGVNSTASGTESSSSNSVIPLISFSVDYLVIAGGGGGGNTISSTPSPGGGGAGGYRTTVGTSGANSAAESALTLNLNTNYAVTVGGGGPVNTIGTNSSVSSITSTGGGRGGTANSGAGGNGGSGGGRGGGGSSTAAGAGTANQGFNGNGSWGNSGGGGGGASSGAQGGGNQTSINGGAGLTSSIDSVARGGGGGGGGNTGEGFGVATAGGGNGTNSGTSAGSGTANTGGGGGGGGGSGSNGASGSGGSGIVILRYPDTRTITIGAGLTGSESAASGGFKRATITAGTGNVSWV
jgi:hypothetical protein